MKRAAGIIVCILLIPTFLPISAMAGDAAHPEISDGTGDARKSADIQKAWFSEDPATPEFLYVTIQFVELNPDYRGTIINGVFWTMNHENYIAYGRIGTYLGENYFWAGLAGTNTGSMVNGSLNMTNGTITYTIPKSVIGSPHTGDILNRTLGATGTAHPASGTIELESIFQRRLVQNTWIKKIDLARLRTRQRTRKRLHHSVLKPDTSQHRPPLFFHTNSKQVNRDS